MGSRTLKLAQEIGADHIMGLAIGNEIDILKPGACKTKLWNHGYYWKATKARISAMDQLGAAYQKVRVTAVISGEAIWSPFADGFLRQAYKEYGDRWAFSYNVYTYWNGKLGRPCEKTIQAQTCWDSETCGMITTFTTARQKVQQITGKSDSTMWITETGWSSPVTSTRPSPASW